MKILHTAMMKTFSSGVAEQMLGEAQVAKEVNINFDVKIFSPYQKIDRKYICLFYMVNLKNKNKIINWLNFRMEYYAWLKSQEENVDCFILRYSAYDPLQYFFIRKSNKPVYLVHHTKELDELRLIEGLGIIYYLIDKIFGRLSIKSSTGIIAVTNELIDYERNRIGDDKKKGILYPNGIQLGDKEIEDKRSTVIPEILFVASYFYAWHGLDLLLDQIEKSVEMFVLHLVGDLMPEDEERVKKDKRIIMHGRLTKQEIEDLSKQCWIGLGSFALYRKNIKQGSTLKVREYFDNGLPVFSGHEDMFPNEFKFYKFDKLNINSIIRFSKEMRRYSKQEIRDNSEIYISKKVHLKKLNDEINLDLSK